MAGVRGRFKEGGSRRRGRRGLRLSLDVTRGANSGCENALAKKREGGDRHTPQGTWDGKRARARCAGV
eukprot:1578345-Prymnesium_polylepis.2